MIAKRKAGQAEFFAKPETKAALRERVMRLAENMSDADRERRRVRGRVLAREVLSRPEVRALSASAEVRSRAGAARTETVLAWCPPEFRDEYRNLIRKNGLRAADARAIIEEQIPGTRAHSRRMVANARDAQIIRHQRQKAQAY